MINGFGTPVAIENARAGIEKEFGVKANYSQADMTKPAEIAQHDQISRIDAWARGCAGQQRGRPACSAGT
jgi:hypothetical protein